MENGKEKEMTKIHKELEKDEKDFEEAAQEVVTGGAGEYEYAFEPVPESAKKNAASLFVILAGYAISLSCFVIGTTIGSQMTFNGALSAALTGDLFLIFIAIVLGIQSYKTGLSTAFMSRKAFGKAGSIIFSVILAFSGMHWIGVNAGTFASLIKATFTWWPIPVAITSILVVALWAQSAIRGLKGLEIVSWIGVPAAIAMTIACIIAVAFKENGLATVASFVPAGTQISFAQACTKFVGGWVFGCIISPDVCRYAKSAKSVVIAGFCGFFIGLFGLNLIGILIAAATAEASFVGATTALGLGVLVFICAIFCLWTTQDNNIYSSGLAIQNILDCTKQKGKVKHAHLAIIISVCAAIYAALGATSVLSPVMTILGVCLPPIPGLILGEAVIKRSKERQTINWIAIVSWIISSVVEWFADRNSIFVPPIIGMALAFLLYCILSKALDGVINRNTVPDAAR